MSVLAEDLVGKVVDVGCGWAELLLQVVDATPDVTGVGLDLKESSIAHGHTLARERGLADRVSLRAVDARTLEGSFAAVICIGASQIWGPPVEANQPLDYGSALRALRRLTAPFAHWLLQNPDDPGADDVRVRAATQRANYFSGYRGILGMAYLELLAV